ncbi:MAG: hypothetical protein Q4F31_04060 [Eubacteriales bacterium]|nr:hypothetical protein [Eubacteriales bacterium]
MNNEDKRKKIISLVLRFAAIAGGMALCVPVTWYLNSLLGNGETDIASMSGAVFCCCLVALTVLAVVSGLRAMMGKPFRLTVAVIGLTAAVCIAAGVISFKTMPETGDSPPVSPRPTVTPPAITIEEVSEIENPESGTVFYKKYYDNPAFLTVDNASSSDMYVKLRDRKGKIVLIFYIRANDTASVNAPVGTYEYICAFGKEWQDEENYFGENTKFRKSKEICSFSWGSTCEISIGRNAAELLDVSRSEFEK